MPRTISSTWRSSGSMVLQQGEKILFIPLALADYAGLYQMTYHLANGILTVCKHSYSCLNCVLSDQMKKSGTIL